MAEKTVDARGMLCPTPLILARQALQEIPIGGVLVITLDNDTARTNVAQFLREQGTRVETSGENGVWTLRATRITAQVGTRPAESYCTPNPAAVPPVIMIRSRVMGAGSDELGTILMKAFINTIKEVSPLPSALVFLTDGIHLVCEGSPVLEPIRALEARGLHILVCGTCLDYFGKKEQLRVGTVSNMFTILEALNAAHHVITP